MTEAEQYFEKALQLQSLDTVAAADTTDTDVRSLDDAALSPTHAGTATDSNKEFPYRLLPLHQRINPAIKMCYHHVCKGYIQSGQLALLSNFAIRHMNLVETVQDRTSSVTTARN
jgi:hypothetical protein